MNEGTCTSTISFSKELWPQLLDHLPSIGHGLGSVAQSSFPENIKGVCILSFLTNTFTMLKSSTRHTTGRGLRSDHYCNLTSLRENAGQLGNRHHLLGNSL